MIDPFCTRCLGWKLTTSSICFCGIRLEHEQAPCAPELHPYWNDLLDVLRWYAPMKRSTEPNLEATTDLKYSEMLHNSPGVRDSNERAKMDKQLKLYMSDHMG
jgi:hypothetical protein